MKPSCATTKLMLLVGGRVAPEHVARAGEPCRELADHAAVAAPEAPRRVAEAVVPFAPANREMAELIAAGPDVPGLGDQLRLGEHGIGGDRLQQRRVRIEAVGPAAERGREIEAEAVDAAQLHPTPKRRDHHIDDGRAVERDAISAAHVVDVALRIVGIEAKIQRVVETAQRQRRSEFVALAIVVDDDIEDRLEPRGAQRVGRAPHFREAARRQARIGAADTVRDCSPRRC